MATDFFQQQDAARRKTILLVVYFILAILTLTGLIYLVVVFLFSSAPDAPAASVSLWNPTLFLVVASAVTLVVGTGSFVKTLQLSAGGKTVALMLGGQQVQGDTQDPRQRRLLNVVEEMAIASGVPAPPVFLLPDEPGINAFAAGHTPGDAIVAVSHGCLEYLNRDELQGVVAHEFSHILNGDMRRNIRLLGLIYGIIVLSTIGQILIHATARSRTSREDDGGRQGLVLLGLALYVLGLAGAFFGRLIQAAVSRQREYLADASAVQFTRNPAGIGGALKKIGGLQAGSAILDAHAAEVSHMFFADAFARHLFALLATHPPLGDRIKRLDSSFDGKYPLVRAVDVSPGQRPGTRAGRIPPVFPRFPEMAGSLLSPEATAAHIGDVTPQEIAYAERLHADIPESLRAAAQEPFCARALIYCLLLDPGSRVRTVQLAALQAGAEPRDYAQVLRLAESVRELSDAARLPLVDLTIPALRQMSPRQHQAFRAQVDGLINCDGHVSVFEYALHCVVCGYLDADFRQARPRARYGSLEKLGPQMAKVLSLLAREGQPEDEGAAGTAFDVGIRSYLSQDSYVYRLLPGAQCPLPEFHSALLQLAEAVPEIKRRVVESCAACIQSDLQVTVREVELLRAVCATLGCPMPPLLVETK
jgi:Zn-dependent protease with chaperone function